MPYERAASLGVEEGFVNGKIAIMVGGANDDEQLVMLPSSSFYGC